MQPARIQARVNRRKLFWRAVGSRLREDFLTWKIRHRQRGLVTPQDFHKLWAIHCSTLETIKRAADAIEFTRLSDGSIGLGESRTQLSVPIPEWSSLFSAEALRIRERFAPNSVSIYHIGSTSIPGLLAKPILDIAVVLPPSAFTAPATGFILKLRSLGYRYLGNWGQRGGYHFDYRTGDGNKQICAIQVHPVGSESLQKLHAFREFIIANPKAALEYQKVKMVLSTWFPNSRGMYAWYKSHWLESVIGAVDSPELYGARRLAAQAPMMVTMVSRTILRTITRGRLGKHPMAL